MANNPAMHAENRVMISTAALVEINQREMMSRCSHSWRLILGMTRNALPHMVTFIV